jgi:L-ascorbate metabolism protein UlaG (beta-lactamase superfamily)
MEEMAPHASLDAWAAAVHCGDARRPSGALRFTTGGPRRHLSRERGCDARLAPSELPRHRIAPRTTAMGRQRREVVNGVAIRLLGLSHGGSRHRHVEHLGFLVEIGGRRVLHVGDTDFEGEAFERLRLDTARVDVALLPSWMVTSDAGRQVIERWIRPRQAVHVGIGEERDGTREVRRAMPSAIVFTRPLESRRW